MLIRKAFEAEYDTIITERIASYSHYKEMLPAAHWKVLESTLSAETAKAAGADLFVSEIDGTIAGSVVLFPAETQAYEWDTEALAFPEIRMLAINNSFKNQGIGKALVLHCINHARHSGSPFVGLHTGSFMEEAMRLYEKLGFERVPALDFEPLNDGIIVKAYRFNLTP